MRVVVINRATPSIDSAQLLAQLHGDSSLRAELAKADIITVTIGHNDTPWVSDDDPCDGSQSHDHANWSKYTRACVATTAQRLRRTSARCSASWRNCALADPPQCG